MGSSQNLSTGRESELKATQPGTIPQIYCGTFSKDPPATAAEQRRLSSLLTVHLALRFRASPGLIVQAEYFIVTLTVIISHHTASVVSLLFRSAYTG